MHTRAGDLAAFCGETTKRFNQQVSRNRERFPEERKVSVHERNIAELADSMATLLAAPSPPPKRPIGFVPLEDKKNKPAGKAAGKTAKGS